jgi:hypothetical protein
MGKGGMCEESEDVRYQRSEVRRREEKVEELKVGS